MSARGLKNAAHGAFEIFSGSIPGDDDNWSNRTTTSDVARQIQDRKDGILEEEQPDPKPLFDFSGLIPDIDITGLAAGAAQTSLVTSLPGYETLFEYEGGEFELTQNGKYAAYAVGALALYFFVLKGK